LVARANRGEVFHGGQMVPIEPQHVAAMRKEHDERVGELTAQRKKIAQYPAGAQVPAGQMGGDSAGGRRENILADIDQRVNTWKERMSTFEGLLKRRQAMGN
jgi:predicted transcriptional regulator